MMPAVAGAQASPHAGRSQCSETEVPLPALSRTPLRNISNAQAGVNPGQAPGPLHKSVLALRNRERALAAGIKALPQVHGQNVNLTTSPMASQTKGFPAPMRSPMSGRTPDDVKRALKRVPAALTATPPLPRILQHSPAQEDVEKLHGIPQPVFQAPVTAQEHVDDCMCPPKVAPLDTDASSSGLTTTAGEHAGPWKMYLTSDGRAYYHQAATNVTQWERPAGFQEATSGTQPSSASHLDPAKEAARLKKLEAKAKREAKAAQKAEADRLRQEAAAAAAAAAARDLAEQNAAVLEAIAGEDVCDLQSMEPVRMVSWELVAIGQSLRVISGHVDIYHVELAQIDTALRQRKLSLENENVLAALHATLLAAASGGLTKVARSATVSSWMVEVKKWAREELGTNTPFHDATLAKQKKEGALDYKQLSYSAKLSLLHSLCAAALTSLLAKKGTEDDVMALRPSPLGVFYLCALKSASSLACVKCTYACPLVCASRCMRTAKSLVPKTYVCTHTHAGKDTDGRTYWHVIDPSGVPSAWVLREVEGNAPQRSRLSVMSSEGTPIKGGVGGQGSGADKDAEGDGQQRVGSEEEAEEEGGARYKDAPDKGEAGENFYWHQQWVVKMAQSARAPYSGQGEEAPALELMTQDEDMLLELLAALWQTQAADNMQLARTLVTTVVRPRRAAAELQMDSRPARGGRLARLKGLAPAALPSIVA